MEALQNRTVKKTTWILLAFIAAKFILQFTLINPDYDLHRDEYLHLDQGDHLAWGYLSLPPFTSWLSWLIKFMGGSVIAVKFFPALFGALTLLVVWRTIEELRGSLYALVLGAACVLLSVLVRINFLYQPNSADILCWTAVYYFLIKYINSQRPKWLFWGGVVFALGFLNKYNVAFLALGLLPALLITGQRKMLAKKELYLAAILVFILILPNLIWQYANNFPVIHHMKELADTQLVHVSRWLFLKEQVIFFISALPVIMSSLYALLFYKPFAQYSLFFWSFVATLGMFMLFRAKGYYAIGLYPVYIAFGSVFLGNVLNVGLKRSLKPVFVLIPVLFCVMVFKIGFSIESPQQVMNNDTAYRDIGMLRWEDGKDHQLPQDMADMLGWKELAAKVDAAISQLPQGHTLVVCDNYGQAGAINYYSANKDIRAVSFNADYINWFELDKSVYNLIRVKELQNKKGELEETAPFFEKGFVSDSVADPLAREYRTTIFVFSRPKFDINARLKADIAEEKWD
ncbi:glycosyltransferase family 39 protein [Flavobacterium sp.]|uniref:glycosyltransferase family 39 protein n=1 Tax=Flavobacterium sp. TaxID=239 RepID=UPI00403317EF